MKRRIRPRISQKARGAITARKVLQLRLAGHSFHAIADMMKMSASSVHEANDRAMQEYASAEDIHEARKRALVRLEHLRTIAWAKLRKNFSVALLDGILRIEVRESAICGYDAAAKLDLSAVVGPNRDEQARLIGQNLSTDEQRELVRLLLKARDGSPSDPPPLPNAPAVPSMPPPLSPIKPPPFAPMPVRRPTPAAEPESPPLTLEAFAEARNLDLEDPVTAQAYEIEMQRYYRERGPLN